MSINHEIISAANEFDGDVAMVRATLPSGRKVQLDVYGPRKRFGGHTLVPAEVNWPSIGSVDTEDAHEFAAAINRAAELGQILSGPTTSEPGDVSE